MVFDNRHYVPLTISKHVENCITSYTFPITVWLHTTQGTSNPPFS